MAVRGTVGHGADAHHFIRVVPPGTVCRLVSRSGVPGADAFFISRTNGRTVGAIAAVEVDLRIPAVSATRALPRRALRIGGVSDRTPGFGSLCGQAGP